jgi:glycosyltransferase involved in cell wall biosynthesis
MLASMVAQGHEVHAVAPGADQEIIAVLQSMGVHCHDVFLRRIGLNPLRDLVSLIHLYGMFLRLRPEYLLAYTIKPVIYGAIAARMAGVPNIYVMITGVGYTFNNKGFKGKAIGMLARALLRISLKHNKRVFFQNRDNLRIFQEAGLLRRQDQPVLINGSGVDLEYYAPAPYPKKTSFLMIARLLGDKGVYEYVEAARQLKAVNPDLEFRLAGWIDENPTAITDDELRSWVCEGVVDYLGHLSDVRPAITNASVYVLPSYHEGMPRTVLEAMAMGRPIITTDVPGCRDTVVEGKNGFLVQAKDASSLGDAMLRFVHHPDLIPVMGEYGLRLAEERFNVHDVNKKILETMGLMC